MSLLPEEDAQYLRESFAELKDPVRLTVVTRERSRLVLAGTDEAGPPELGDASEELKQLFSEIAAASPKLTLENVDAAADGERALALVGERLPATVLSTAGAKGRLRFYGLPAGYEMSTMIATILDLGMGEETVPPEVRERLAALDRDVHIQVFVTPSCPNCPPMARAAFQLAAASPRITADVVEVQEFLDLAQKYEIRGVPLTVVNEGERLLGAVPPMQLLDAVTRAGKSLLTE